MDIRMRSKDIVCKMEQYFNLDEHVETPSSYWDESMVMLSDEPELPLELRLYVSWKPYQEKSQGSFVWFCPWHVFRRVSDESYVLAMDNSAKQWVEWSKKGGWSLKTWTTEKTTSLDRVPFLV
jgi:hypothetical protein